MPTSGVGIAEHADDGQTEPGGQVHGAAVAAEQAVAACETVSQLTQTASRKGLYPVAELLAQVRRFPIVTPKPGILESQRRARSWPPRLNASR